MGRVSQRDGTHDPVHIRLLRAVGKRRRAYLWIPEDAITFKPALLSAIYGDGRALFTMGTINQRPRYWVIRGDSRWKCGLDREDAGGPDFAELSDDILTDLEGEFGSGLCGYSGSSLFWPKRKRECDCEECSDRFIAKWPMVNGSGGHHWSRMDWPTGFLTVPNPAAWDGNLLAATTPDA
jgi:hypothetical protein